MPDIHRRGKGVLVVAAPLLAAGFAFGYLAGTRAPSGTSPADGTASGASRTSTEAPRPVELRIDPSRVRLADTTLELKPLPPPPGEAAPLPSTSAAVRIPVDKPRAQY